MTSMASRAAAAGPTRPWPAEQVELWPIERLIPYANNPRLHSAADLERIAASILKWGWTNPVLVDEQGVLIAGHGRVAAAARGKFIYPPRAGKWLNKMRFSADQPDKWATRLFL